MKRRYLGILAAVCLSWFVAGCSRSEKAGYSFTSREGYEPVAVLETTKGAITLAFHPDRVPSHVENFVNLCGAGFFDGTYFHRVAPGFMIQGGDPNTKDDDLSNDGLGGHTYAGPNTTLRMGSDRAAFSRGSIAMARPKASRDSAGSQFFIMLADAPALNGQYTVFGEVIEGIEVADQLSEEPGTPVDGVGGFNPTRHQYIEKCVVKERPVVGQM